MTTIIYYEVEWTDADGEYHMDIYVPMITPFASTSFYHKCKDPRSEALGFINKLVKYDLFPFKMDMKKTTVRLEL